jgi:DNA (cytosine-5)-methyltransferase 1
MRELSLFSGSGIGALAAQEAGIETVAFCEPDEWCQYVLRGLWPGVPVFPDVAALTADALPGGIDIISGGFPCQDISSAGKGVGITGERSGLWFEMLRLVREVRPRWVLAENVPALRTRGADIVIAGLEEAGYTVWPLVVGAWCCGAPHRRNRVWIVAQRKSDGLEGWPARERSETREDAAGGSQSLRGEWRWPLGPGAEQREWEYPRMVQSAKSRLEGQRADAGESAQSESRDAGGRTVESSLGRSTDGLAGSLPPSVRRATLRILGNAWVPSIPALIYRWIVMQEGVEISDR